MIILALVAVIVWRVFRANRSVEGESEEHDAFFDYSVDADEKKKAAGEDERNEK